MSTCSVVTETLNLDRGQSDYALAASITRAASKQTYYTIRFLVDRDLIVDAYRAYAYFRWVDDRLDRELSERCERLAFVARQQSLVDHCYCDNRPHPLDKEEHMLANLIRGDRRENGGLQLYIRNMMAVMAFDAERKGRLISRRELTEYTRWLATAVTEAMHYFIGHQCATPHSEARYLAVSAAHITHMLRDTHEDGAAGYFNIPLEFIQSQQIDPQDVGSEPYRAWIQSRVQLARTCFKAGMDYIARVASFRCRMAGFAYFARFEGVLDAIERDGYRLRPEYPECKGLGAGVSMGGSVLLLAFNPRLRHISPALPVR